MLYLQPWCDWTYQEFSQLECPIAYHWNRDGTWLKPFFLSNLHMSWGSSNGKLECVPSAYAIKLLPYFPAMSKNRFRFYWKHKRIKYQSIWIAPKQTHIPGAHLSIWSARLLSVQYDYAHKIQQFIMVKRINWCWQFSSNRRMPFSHQHKLCIVLRSCLSADWYLLLISLACVDMRSDDEPQTPQ